MCSIYSSFIVLHLCSLIFCHAFQGLTLLYNRKVTINSPINILILSESLSSIEVTFELHTPTYVITSFLFPGGQKFSQTKNIYSICNGLGIKDSTEKPSKNTGFYIRARATFYRQGDHVMTFTVTNTETQDEIFNKKYQIVVIIPPNQCIPEIRFKDCSSPHSPRKIALHRRSHVQAIVTKGCGMNSQIDYNWEVNDFLDRVTRTTFSNSNSRTLTIPEFKLWFNDFNDAFHKLYTIKITADEKSANGSYSGRAMGRCYVAVITAPPSAKIKFGSSRKVNVDKPFTLDGSTSRDMASPKEGINLKYKWSCTSTSTYNKFCKQNMGSGQMIRIPSKVLLIGTTYKFTLEVESKRTMFTSKTLQEVIPTKEDPLLLSYNCIRNCFEQMASRSQIMHLLATCENCEENTTFEWSELKPQATVLMTGPRLIFQASQFPDGANTVTLKLDAKGSIRTGSITLEIKIMKLSKIGTCSVTPKQGEEFSTEFRINCINFESDNEPLTYTLFQDNQLLLSHQQPDINIKLFKSKGQTEAKLKLEVRDALHVTFQQELNIPLTTLQIPANSQGILAFLNKAKLSESINTGDMATSIVPIRIAVENIKKAQQTSVQLELTEQILDMLAVLSLSTTEDVEILSSSLHNLLETVTSKDTLAGKTSKIFEIASETLGKTLRDKDFYDLSHERCTTMTENFVQVAEKFFEPIVQFPQVHTMEVARPENYEEENYADYGELDFSIVYRINNWKRCAESTRKLFQKLGLAAFYVSEANEDEISVQTKGVLWKMKVIGAEYKKYISLTNEEVSVTVPSTVIHELIQKDLPNSKVGIQTMFTKENPYWWYPDQHKINSMVAINAFSSIYPQNDYSVSNINSNFDTYFTLASDSASSTSTTTEGHVLPKEDMPIYQSSVPRNSFFVVQFLATSAPIRVLTTIGVMPKYREVLKSNALVTMPSNPFDMILFNFRPEDATGYVAILPFGSASEPIVFQFNTTIYSCKNWDPQSERWTINHCRAGRNTNTTHLHCQCNHFSHFAAYIFKTPNSLELPRDVITSLQANITFIIMFLLVLFILLGLLFWSKYRDQTDQVLAEVIFADAYDPEKNYMYLVTISTGSYRQAGTTANILLKLIGEESSSEEYVLSCRKFYKAFRRRSETTFGLMTYKYLGPLQSITLSNDYSGRYPSWYCNFVRIKDPVRQEEFVFIVNKWLSQIYHSPLHVELTPAAEKYIKNIKYVITEHFRRCFTEMYLWYGLFYPHTRSPLNRKEKAIVFVTGFCFGAMLSMMFFQRTSLDNVEEERIKYKRFILKFSNILHTVLCTIIGMLLGMGIVTLFIKSKKSSSQPFKIVYGKQK